MLARIVIIILCCTFIVLANETFYDMGKQGWFNYLDDPKILDKNLTQREDSDRAFIESIPFDSLEKLSAEEISALINKTKAIAVMKPTTENILAFKRLTKFATDQSEKFSQVFIMSNFENPDLAYPTIAKDKYAVDALDAQKILKRKTWFIDRPYLTLVLFYDSNEIELVLRQKNVYRLLKLTYQINEAFIEHNQNKSLIEQLKIKQPVENFIYDARTKNYYRISAWLASEDELIRNMMFVVSQKGL